MPRVGEAVEATGLVGPSKLAEVIADVTRLGASARAADADPLLFAATEALRRAGDRDAALTALSAAAGVPCRLLSSEAEARLAFRGATATHGGPGLTLVADVGGGSTQCVLGEGSTILALRSLPLGSGAITGRYLADDPPTEAQRRACAAAVRQAVREAPDGHPRRGVVTGGTATTLPALLDRKTATGNLDADDLEACRRILAGHPSAEVARRHGIEPARARVLPGGLEIVAALLERYALERLAVSLEGLRQGMILAWLERGAAWVEG